MSKETEAGRGAVAAPVEPTVMQHTPGPWRAVRDEVWVGKSRRICPRVTAGESLPLGKDVERGKVNARLIAAAPELLASMLEVLRYFGAPGDECFSDAALQRARDAVHKALHGAA